MIKEWGNPLVRPFLHTYPEDAGDCLSEAPQAAKWHDEVNPNLAAPMARALDGNDYYVEEPALVKIAGERQSLGLVMPVMVLHWFRREGKIYAKAHQLHVNR